MLIKIIIAHVDIIETENIIQIFKLFVFVFHHIIYNLNLKILKSV